MGRVSLVIVILATAALGRGAAQNSFPIGGTRPEIEAKIKSLEEERATILSIRRDNLREAFSAIDVSLTKGFDASVGTLTVRSDEIQRFRKTVQDAAVARKLGNNVEATQKAIDAARQIRDALTRVSRALTGDPKATDDIIKRFWYARKPAQDAIRNLLKVSGALETDKVLKGIDAAIAKDIAQYNRRLPSAPYGRPDRSAPPSPSGSELDDAIRLMEWLDKGNRAFQSEAERKAFFAKFPQMEQYAAAADIQPPTVGRPGGLPSGTWVGVVCGEVVATLQLVLFRDTLDGSIVLKAPAEDDDGSGKDNPLDVTKGDLPPIVGLVPMPRKPEAPEPSCNLPGIGKSSTDLPPERLQTVMFKESVLRVVWGAGSYSAQLRLLSPTVMQGSVAVPRLKGFAVLFTRVR